MYRVPARDRRNTLDQKKRIDAVAAALVLLLVIALVIGMTVARIRISRLMILHQ